MGAVIWLLAALTALAPLSMDAYLPALPELSDQLATGTSAVQLTLAACLIGLAAGQLVAGPVSDAHGRRGPLLASLGGFVAASLLCAAAPSIELLVACRLVQGATAAVPIVLARAVAADQHRGSELARVYGRLVAIAGAVPVLAPILGALLLGATSWRGVFVVEAAIGILLAAAAARLLPETLPRHARRPSRGLRATAAAMRRLTQDRPFLAVVLVQGFAFAAMFACIAALPFLVQERYGMSTHAFSLVFAVNALGLAACAHAGPALLLGRRSERELLRLALAVLGTGARAVVAAVLLLDAIAWALLPALSLVVASVGLALPPATALALAGRPPGELGSASAALGFAQFAIAAAAAPLVGATGAGDATPLALVVAAVAGGAALAFAATPDLPSLRTRPHLERGSR